MSHLEEHNILTHLQHRFHSRMSTVTQLLLTTQDIYQWDNKTQVDIGISEFAKAFDKVPHRSLLKKLHHYGIDNNIHTWITSFLTNGIQSAVVDGATSLPTKVISGVPQGTVLGTLLFLLYINDLPSVVSSQVRLYADDCILYRAIQTVQDQLQLQKDLNDLEQWAKKWGMEFNAKKCEIMRISRSSKPLQHLYSIGGEILSEVHKAKYLGITLSDTLSWSPYVNETVNKASGKIAFLPRNLHQCPQRLKEQAYLALVHSVLEYEASVWDPHLKKDVNALEGVQRCTSHFVTNNYDLTSSVTAMLKSLGWESLQDGWRDIRLALMYKIVHAQVAIPANDLLVKADSRTWANHKHKFRHIPATSEAYKHSFFPELSHNGTAFLPRLWRLHHQRRWALSAHLLAAIRLAHSPITVTSHLGICRSSYRYSYTIETWFPDS